MTYWNTPNNTTVNASIDTRAFQSVLYITEERLREIIREELAALSVHATVETENNDQSAQAK